MSYIKNNLLAGEKIIYQPPISKLVYIWVLINFALSFMPFGLIRLARTELALTNQRLIGRTGRTTIALPHAKIGHIAVRQGVLGNILGYGTVVITGKDGTEAKFKGILWPLIFQQEVDEAIEVAVLGRKLSDFGADKPYDEKSSSRNS